MLAAPLAMAATALFGLVTHFETAALGAGPGLEPLHGHQPLVPPGATLLGPAPSSTVLPLTVTLQPRDPAALAAEAQAVSDPTSPDYHHFLAPQQFAQRFGPTPATVAQVTATLKQAGLAVGPPSSTGLSMPVSGSVAQVQSAFATPIDLYRLSSGKTGYHNRVAPEVPVTVAPEIQGILGLDTLSPPQPTTTLPDANATEPGAEGLGVTPALAPGQPAPTGTSCTSSINGVQKIYGALDAVELAQAYSFDPLYASGDYGAGSTVALVEMSGAGFSSSDITTFANCYGITPGAGQITEKDVLGGGATGPGTVEAELDIDTVLSLAPKANIEVYEGGSSASLYTVFNQIVSDDTAKIVSASWTNGCEAYVGQSYQNSENTLFQAAAVEGQSVFVAAGDQGAEGCNVNGVETASTGSHPLAQVVNPSTGTLYIANKSSNTVSVDSEGSAGNPSTAVAAGSVATGSGSGPDAVALDTTDGKVFVANGTASSLTAFSTATCNQGTTSGCGSTTQIASGGHLSSPTAVAVNGSTLYVANSSGSVAVYNASTNAYVTTVSLPSGSSPTSLAVDAANGFVYVGDAGTVSRIDYFNAATCNSSVTTGCSTTPSTVAVGQDPVGLVVDDAAGSLYVADAGTGGGISVVSLSTYTLTATISTGQPSVTGIDGVGLVQSVGLSPSGNQVLAVLDGLTFPGDVLATINPSTQTIVSTVNLETGTDTMGALASDGTRNYVWVTDVTKNDDVVQNLNLAVSDPASQPYVTAVGGTSVQGLGPAPTETTWNDQLHYAEGAGGGGISQTFTMPAFQQTLGTVAGSSGTPCGNTSGDCREVPDVSADADPSTGYVVYDAAYNGPGWTAIGGTSGASPLWAAVLAVAASADANSAGYGAMNPILYTLAQKSPGTYLNDVTTGNNDYNATDGGQFAATSGYDMATGLGTPVASALATGLTMIPLDVAVWGSQVYGGSPTFGATVNFAGSSSPPSGVTVSTTGVDCTEVGTSTPISPALAVGSDTLLTSSCSGVSLSGADATDYTLIYTSASGDFTVAPVPVDVAVSGSQTYGGSPTFSGSASPPPGISISTASLTCTQVFAFSIISPTLAAGSHELVPESCSGASLSGTDAAEYEVAYTSATGDFTVAAAALSITASSGPMTYGGAPPLISPTYSGFVNSESASSLTTKPTCSTTATSASPVSGSPYTSSCSGAVDPNYAFTYVPGSVTVDPAPLTITASNGSMTYGGTPPTVTPAYSGFVNGNTASSLTTPPSCTSTATSASPVAGSPYASSCSGAVDANYAFSYVPGSVTVARAPLTIDAASTSMTYGSLPPTITPAYSGFVNGDTPLSLTTAPTCSTTATSSSTVSGSPYTSSCTGAVDPNYTVTYGSGSVVVNRAPLTVTASSSAMTYGGTPPSITPAYGGFVNGDSASSLQTKPTCSTTATSASSVLGSPYASACAGAVDSNYTISYTAGTVTVAQAPLTVTASNGSMTYGSTPAAILPEYGGFVNGDSASSLTTRPTCSTSATSSSSVVGSPYASSCSGAADPNYAITYDPGIMSVTGAPLTVSASSGSMTYGGMPPVVIPAYSGFVNGETPLSLAVQPTCSTTATSSSPASPPTYPATCSGAIDSNYVVTYAAGAVTIGRAPLTITAASGSMAYGGSPPVITPAYSGFVNGDSASSLTTKPTCSTAAAGGSPVLGSPYASSCSGAMDSNYTITYAAGTVTVSQAPLTVTASSLTMTYGATPAITPTYTGFVNGDAPTSLTSPPTCSTTATSTSPVQGSPYASSCSGAVDPNYAFAYVSGTVAVTQAPLTVTGSSDAMTYGSTPPTVTPVYSGFKNGDNASSLTAQPTCSTTATATSAPSPPAYPSTCSGAVAANYAVSYAAGAITVNPAPLRVTASSGTMAYGGTPPVISPTYSGFVNGDTAASLTTAAACTPTATSTSSVAGSPYASMCGGAVDPDYAFTYAPGVVTVSAVPLTITASNGSMTYGGTPPVITPAYGGFVNGDSASSLKTKPTCTTSAKSASPVGSPYPSSCNGAVDSNYAFTYANGSVTVSPASLTVTASSPSVPYGSTPPAITPEYSGFENGDTASSLTTQPICSTTATATSAPSPPTYANSCSGASAPNYSISYAAGATTVTPAPVDVAVAGSQAWGGSPTFTASPQSVPSGVTVQNTSGVSCSEVAPSTAITPTLGAGTYTLVPTACGGASLSGAVAVDYTVVYVPGSFSVTGGPPPPPPPADHGYWLVGSDGGIFTFGSATFHGSTGSLRLQRPVVGITPTADEGGYWLVASDGGIFAFGDAGFHGSIPGLGLHPAGSGLPNSLDAPIVGMVPSSDGGGYFMVASDGGVFAFGDAQFEGSCPGRGGCSGAAVAVVPDATGRGYWLVTQTGNVYTFGDAPYFGAPGAQGSPITAAVRTADGGGYFVLLANGTVDGYGDAVSAGGPSGSVDSLDPASAIFTEAGGGGYWVASAAGDVFTYGGAPNDGSMAGDHLNGAIIAGSGF